MVFKKHNRQYDVVVFGATGYTGQLVAEYITTSLPTNLKWAIAGRSESKLQAVVEECTKLNPDRSPPAIETADVNDDTSVGALAKKTFLLITTVGPYCQYGEHAVKACAESDTHYLDVTGEFFWVRRMISKYEKAAKESGAILIPQIGMDSSPADLCTWSLASCLRKEMGAQTRDVTLSLQTIGSTLSGGTIATVLTMFDQFTLQEISESSQPFALSPIPHPAEPKRHPKSIWQILFGVHTVRNLGMVSTASMAFTDRGEVERSWGLLSQIPSRKHEFYGPNFHWAEYIKVRNWLHGAVTHWVLMFAATLLAFVPPTRALARKYVPGPGTGPSREDRAKAQVEYRGVANPDTKVPSNKQAACRAWFQGSPYYLTAIFVGQAALTILEDDLELDGGFYTPCCLGQAFIDRTHEAGFKLEVKIQDK